MDLEVLFSPVVLGRMLDKLSRTEPSNWTEETFFTDEPVIGDGEFIEIDVNEEAQTMSPFVHPEVQAKAASREGLKKIQVATPYIKEVLPSSLKRLLQKTAGGGIYKGAISSMTAKVNDDLLKMRRKVMRRKEWMAVKAMVEAKITVLGDGYSTTVDFGRKGTHKITNSGSDKWDTTTGDPMGDIETAKELILDDSNLTCDTMIVGRDVWKAIQNNAKILSKFDNRNFITGQLTAKMLSRGVTEYGTLSGLRVIQYEQNYIDPVTKTLKSYIPANSIIFCTSKAGGVDNRIYHGPILDFDNSNLQLREFSKMWTEKNPSVLYHLLQCSSMPAPLDVNATVWMEAV